MRKNNSAKKGPRHLTRSSFVLVSLFYEISAPAGIFFSGVISARLPSASSAHKSLLLGNPFSCLLQSSYFWDGLTSRLLCFFCSYLLTEFCCWESLKDRHLGAQLALWLGSHTPSGCGERILHSVFLAQQSLGCELFFF